VVGLVPLVERTQGGIAVALASEQSPTTTLDHQMIAEGKSRRELAQYLFDSHGCRTCHTIGSEGKFGFTKLGEERAQGFEGYFYPRSFLRAQAYPLETVELRKPAERRASLPVDPSFRALQLSHQTPGAQNRAEAFGVQIESRLFGRADIGLARSQPDDFVSRIWVVSGLSQHTVGFIVGQHATVVLW
jgi:hypothetical protein